MRQKDKVYWLSPFFCTNFYEVQGITKKTDVKTPKKHYIDK